jgi:hypothetical protein
MAYDMTEWFSELEACASKSIEVAKKNAERFDCGLWELPSGRYVTLQQGPPVPDGATLIAKRTTPGGRWNMLADHRDADLCAADFGF